MIHIIPRQEEDKINFNWEGKKLSENEFNDIQKLLYLENVEIKEIKDPLFDAQTVADEIALTLERIGNLKFKVTAYKKLQEIIAAGALGCEIRLSGKLPGDRAKSWRFSEGYLKKAGESSKIVNRAEARANTLLGTIGIKVSILPQDAVIEDQIDVNQQTIDKIKLNKLNKDGSTKN